MGFSNALMKGMFTTLLSVGLLLSVTPVANAKIKPIQEIQQIPENADEQRLWEIASNHENNVFNDGRMYNNEEIEAYLEAMAYRMLGDDIDHTGVKIDFFVVLDPRLSAWVYPYGTIAVHSGLIAGLENEAQLAAIIGHELSHFLQRHSYRELISERRQGAIGKGLGLLLTAAAATQTGAINTDLMKAGGLWTDLVTSGYSRKNEHIADAEGLTLMKNAGYERHEAIAAFKALKDNDQYGAVNVRHLWSSHPKLDDRIDNVTKAVKKEQRSKKYEPGTPVDSLSYYKAMGTLLMANARLDLNERMFERARMALGKYLQAYPDDPEALFWMGESYRLEAPGGPDFAQRMQAYQSALQNDSGHATAYRELGLALRQNGQHAEAKIQLNRYLELRPDAVDKGIIQYYIETP